MPPVTQALVERVIAVMGADGMSGEEIERSVLALAQDPMLARRLIDWIPEAFGLVLAPHVASVTLPTTFSAKSRRGAWMEFDLRVEPIVPVAIRLGAEMYHAGPSDAFRNIAIRGGIFATLNKALNHGSPLDGATLSGPAMLGIPAETYLPKPVSLWRRLFK